MSDKESEIVVAEVIRIEHNSDTDQLLLVFEVVDSNFKRKIKLDWTKNVYLKVVNKKLIEVK